MTSTKKDHFFDHLHSIHLKKLTTDLILKNNRMRKHVTNFKNKPPAFRVNVINVYFLTQTTLFDFVFSLLSIHLETYCQLTRTNKSSKTYLKPIIIQN